MVGHALLSPSGAYRWIHCPGSALACVDIPDPGSPYAAEGTFAHEIAAATLLGLSLQSFLGFSRNGFTADQEMLDHIQVYVDYVRELAWIPGATLRIEERVHFDRTTYGTADSVIHVAPQRTLHVVDLKFGQGVGVDADNNAQLRIYGLAALRTFQLDSVQEVHLHIVQPRYGAGEPSVEIMSRGALEEWAEEVIEPAKSLALDDQAPRSAGPWCRFCKAAPVCSTLRAYGVSQAVGVFEDPKTLAPAKTPRDPKTLTPETISGLLEAFPLVEHWIKVVREHAHNLASSGVGVPGHKLVRKQGLRRWTDEALAEDLLRVHIGDAAVTSKVVTPAAAERALKKNPELWSIVAPLVEIPDRGTALVPESDKRPAWSPDAVFTDL